jgi:hypothetical protein
MPPEISLRHMVHVAEKNLGGDVEISGHDGGRVTNKGSIGTKIASLFSSIGRAFGAKDTRAQRQQDTLDGFRNSLRMEYGNTIADKVLEKNSDALHGGRLSGRTVIKVISDANEAYRGGDPDFRHLRVEALARPGAKIYEEIRKDPDVRKTGFPATTHIASEYEERVRDRCRDESDRFREPISEARLKQIAKEEAIGVMAVRDNIDKIGKAREDYDKALAGFVEVATHGSREDIARSLTKASHALDRHLLMQGKDGMSDIERQKKLETDMMVEVQKRIDKGANALRNISDRDRARMAANEEKISNKERDALIRLQSEAPDGKSKLRRLYLAGGNIQRNPNLMPGQHRLGANAELMTKALVGALGRVFGSHRSSTESDMEHFGREPSGGRPTPPPLRAPQQPRVEVRVDVNAPKRVPYSNKVEEGYEGVDFQKDWQKITNEYNKPIPRHPNRDVGIERDITKWPLPERFRQDAPKPDTAPQVSEQDKIIIDESSEEKPNRNDGYRPIPYEYEDDGSDFLDYYDKIMGFDQPDPERVEQHVDISAFELPKNLKDSDKQT